jgi:small subunit ribosomal protein S17
MARQKEFTGIVTSNKMQKTVVVKIMRMAKHPKYSRVIKQYAKFKAHDEKQAAKEGDTVRIVETRPLSRDKRFMVKEIVKKAQMPHVEITEEIK